MRSLHKIILRLLEYQFVFFLPRKAKYLIHGPITDVIFKYISPNECNNINLSKEVNIPIFILSLFHLNSLKSFQNYENLYINHVNPQVILTFIDNNLNFFKLKNKNTNFKTIAIQNGQRAAVADIFTEKNFKEKKENNIEYTADYILCFNKSIGKFYSKLIKTKIIPIGSLINNIVSLPREIGSNKILFISQFRQKEKGSESMYFDNENNPVCHDNFYKAECLILPYLLGFCKQNNYLLQICGCKLEDEQKLEKAFYDEMLREASWEYLPRKGKMSSYENIGRANIIINIDSTLGYEALAQGKKVAFFSIRGFLLHEPSFSFAWPGDKEKGKYFSTNTPNSQEYYRILNYLINVSEADWSNVVRQSREEIMEYDPGNTKLTGLIKKLENA